MDTLTLVLVDTVLRERSIRGAARALDRPASSLAAAIARFEDEVSVRLVERSGTALGLTLEAERLMPDIALAAARAKALGSAAAIKLQTLERFSQVVAQGSIRRAARLIGLGQPQLTRQIAQLEFNLDCQLLTRSSDGAMPTADGIRVAAQIQSLLEIWQRISRAAGERFRKVAATVRLGSVIPLGYESEIARLLANLTANWLAGRPDVPLFVSSTTAEELVNGLRSGLFDLALLDTQFPPPDCDGVVVARTALALVGGSEIDEADVGVNDLRSSSQTLVSALLLAAPLAVPSPRSGLRQRINTYLEQALTEAQRDKVRLVEIDSIPVILNLVLHHGFLSVLPQASLARIKPDLVQTRLPEQYDMNFWLCWPRRTGAKRLADAVLLDMDKKHPTGNDTVAASPPIVRIP
ncbi:LysR family transcriptional regulator [Devosia sp.]|uniref:LysR family transcriptional regulator n=1 Tax=Devosia sp. TaxID=1871048 RepID=UPI0032652D8A